MLSPNSSGDSRSPTELSLRNVGGVNAPRPILVSKDRSTTLHKGIQSSEGTNENQVIKPLKNKFTVIGLVYSDSCIHCVHLKPVWKKMKAIIDKKVKAGRYQKPYYLEVEHSNIQKLDNFNEKHASLLGGEKIAAEGYPTCFKVESGVIEYYKGNRESNEMENWYMQNSHKVPKRTMNMKRNMKKNMKKNTKRSKTMKKKI
jgi:hypothetical protein